MQTFSASPNAPFALKPSSGKKQGFRNSCERENNYGDVCLRSLGARFNNTERKTVFRKDAEAQNLSWKKAKDSADSSKGKTYADSPNKVISYQQLLLGVGASLSSTKLSNRHLEADKNTLKPFIENLRQRVDTDESLSMRMTFDEDSKDCY